MATLNKNEYGQKVYINIGEDVSSASSITIKLQPQKGETLTKGSTDGVAVGSTNITVNNTDLIANEYLEYTIKEGDLTYAGTWRIKGEAQLSATNKVISNYSYFEVNE